MRRITTSRSRSPHGHSIGWENVSCYDPRELRVDEPESQTLGGTSISRAPTFMHFTSSCPARFSPGEDWREAPGASCRGRGRNTVLSRACPLQGEPSSQSLTCWEGKAQLQPPMGIRPSSGEKQPGCTGEGHGSGHGLPRDQDGWGSLPTPHLQSCAVRGAPLKGRRASDLSYNGETR